MLFLLFFFFGAGWSGIRSDITRVAPNHDKHHRHFIGQTDEDRAENQAYEEAEYTEAAERQEGKGKQYNKDSGDVVDDLQDWLEPHDFEAKEIFEPLGEFALGGFFFVDKEEINQDATDDSEDGGDNHPDAGAFTDINHAVVIGVSWCRIHVGTIHLITPIINIP